MHKVFHKVVEEAWSSQVSGTPLFKPFSKLKILKVTLRAFNLKHYGGISIKVAKAKAKLEAVQNELQLNVSPSLLDEEHKALEDYLHLALPEEAFYKQKARDNSLKLGDQSTSYFHRKVKSHCSRNKILSIQDDQGERIEDHGTVKATFIDFHNKLLGTSFQYSQDAKSYVGSLMYTSLPLELLESLDREVTDEEIKATLFSLPSHKAPGPDGFTPHFFKKAWSIVVDDFLSAIKSFFNLGKLLKVVNSTSIALVPKTLNPSEVTDYRPISCCTTICKCISKITANRLKKLMPIIISTSQAAFVRGRSISNQILLMQESVWNYHRKNMSPRSALKIDLMKAFNSVSWDLILDALQALNLPCRLLIG